MSNLKYQTTTTTLNYMIQFNNFRMDCTERLISDWVISIRKNKVIEWLPSVRIAPEKTNQ
jgi:hypothetical protein